MNKFISFIKKELQEAAVPFVYFFFAFHLGGTTKLLVLEAYHLTPTNIVLASVGALIVAKAILIADSLAVINLFSALPAIYTVLWKTLIYGFLCIAFRFIEELIPLLSKYHGFVPASEHIIDDISWPLFLVIQLWLMFSLFLYNIFSSLDKQLGPGSIKKALFGKRGLERAVSS